MNKLNWSTLRKLRIDSDRLRADFDALAAVGATQAGGVHRPALSPAHAEAREWFRAQVQSAGLDHAVDSAGNHSALLTTDDPAAPSLLVGSHLDSVPNGGRFDGALGVVAALEVLRVIQSSGTTLPVHLEAMDFLDEEGTWMGLTGSRALVGQLNKDDIGNVRGGSDAFDKAMASHQLHSSGLLQARRDPAKLLGFLEIHVEQSQRLTSAAADIGIVTSIAGINAFEVTFSGRADHSGTTPMGDRRDAGLGAATLMLAGRTLVIDEFPNCVINFGEIHLQPGAYNIVPAHATLALEFRAPDSDTLNNLAGQLSELAEKTAASLGLDVGLINQSCSQPIRCSSEIQQAFADACTELSLKTLSLYSGAGHDTQSLASVCPSGMIFIPSTGGSHNPREHAQWQDCVNGANVLLLAVISWLEQVLES